MKAVDFALNAEHTCYLRAKLLGFSNGVDKLRNTGLQKEKVFFLKTIKCGRVKRSLFKRRLEHSAEKRFLWEALRVE
jgi:hypothetical protein